MAEGLDAPWSKDLMGRKGVAKFLTQYLDANEDVNVLNVNAPWGAGKTFFLENWAAELYDSRAVIYFNAWTHDYAGDAFVALTAALNDALEELIPGPDVSSKLQEFRGKAVDVIRVAAPAIAKGVIKKVSGVEYDSVVEDVERGALADAAERALEELLISNKKTMNLIADFKARFSSLAAEASFYQSEKSNTDKRPLYVFIDELDRCRPTFSIELLEKIKHFFDVKGCKFIIACDLEQLQHSIGAVYGAGFEGGKYLKRFFDAEYSLSFSNLDAWIKAQEFDVASYSKFPLRTVSVAGGSRFGMDDQMVEPMPTAILGGDLKLNTHQIILLAIALTFKLKLRELEKCLKHILAVQASIGRPEFDLFFASYLVVLRDEAPGFYRRILDSDSGFSWQELSSKYPPRHFYLGDTHVDVHSVAQRYFRYFHRGYSDISQDLRQDSRVGLDSYVLWQFSNKKYELMRSYPKYVDLAHSID